MGGSNSQSTVLNHLEEVQKITVREWERFSHETKLGYTVIPFYYSLYRYIDNSYHAYRQDANYRVSAFEGYSAVKDFYGSRSGQADYIPDSHEHSRTLYWNPDVHTGRDGKVRIGFYNNAFCRQPEINAEGLTKDGTPVTNRK